MRKFLLILLPLFVISVSAPAPVMAASSSEARLEKLLKIVGVDISMIKKLKDARAKALELKETYKEITDFVGKIGGIKTQLLNLKNALLALEQVKEGIKAVNEVRVAVEDMKALKDLKTDIAGAAEMAKKYRAKIDAAQDTVKGLEAIANGVKFQYLGKAVDLTANLVTTLTDGVGSYVDTSLITQIKNSVGLSRDILDGVKVLKDGYIADIKALQKEYTDNLKAIADEKTEAAKAVLEAKKERIKAKMEAKKDEFAEKVKFWYVNNIESKFKKPPAIAPAA